MSVLKKILNDRIACAVPPARPTVDDHQPKTTNQPTTLVDCPTCGDTTRWVPIGVNGGHPQFSRCWNCSPPVSEKMVREKFFFDDRGRRWDVTEDADGNETFWLGELP